MQWKTIPGYDSHYRVNELGEVWSEYKNDFLAPCINKDDGYVRLSIKDDVWLLHRLVAVCFFGYNENMYVNHKDGDKQNNCVNNLEWVTQKENALHCAHEINEQGQNKPPKSELFELRKNGYSYSQLATKYDVCKTTIARWLGYKRSDTSKLKKFTLMQGEIAKLIPGYTHYHATNFGRIMSAKSGKALKPQIQPNGYVKVGMVENGHRTRKYVHRLVMFAFHGESDLVVNHKNGNKQDNSLNNLEYVTQSQNIKKSSKRKLSKQDCLDIYRLKQNGLHRKEIAKIYGICETYVNRICRKVKDGNF